ncbi:hypothetical protein DRW07_11310 [Alteromonas sediminis]|uniref:histidine kinase n=1 Tax=Alteromonas sediminis TaxID=2259342 RepID=A0A3N5Y0M5_9ALTE|nr:ATP-binding protein [Alteromonas sediminis]RPJ66660.1 hypothetical protein DRW07_11310 [Alteromonas sediminis]
MDADADIALKKKRLGQIITGIEIAVLCASIISLFVINTTSTFLLIFFALMFGFGYVLLRQNKVSLAANYVVLVTTVFMLVFIWLFNGLNDEVLLVFPALIAFAVMVGTPKLLWVVFSVTALNILAIGLLNDLGLRQEAHTSGGLTSATFILIILSLVTYCILVLGKDLTQALSQLRQYGDELEHKVEARTHELEKSLADLRATQGKLVESEKMASMGQLIAGVAHEMNTPVGIMFTSSSLLVDMNKKVRQQIESGALTKSDLLRHANDADELSQLILKNSERAAALINDFKKVAASKDEERRSEFDLIAQLTSITEAYLTLHALETDKVSICVQSDTSVHVFQDKEAINQIFTNFVANSLLHGFDGTEGTISIQVDVVNDDVMVVYRDNGKGLSEEAKKHIFDPFFTTKRNKGGTGLGMHIVYNLITQSLGGSISVDHNQEAGVGFTIVFPKRRK